MSINFEELIEEFKSNLKLDYNLKKKNWFNIGGTTKAFYKADSLKELIRFLKKIPGMLKVLGKWFIDAVKESIAQVFTLLGFFIAWFTLTGSAQDIVGIAIVVSVIIWLVTIRLRD